MRKPIKVSLAPRQWGHSLIRALPCCTSPSLTSLLCKYRVYVQGPRRGNDFSATGPAGLIKVWVSSGEGDINQPSGNWPLANL
jgi:hypothetical protein